MIDWETAAPIAAVTVPATPSPTVSAAPVAYYGFGPLPIADPSLSSWLLMLPAYPRGNGLAIQSLVTRGPRLRPAGLVLEGGRRPYDFHQYTPAGRVAGIATQVDRRSRCPRRAIAWHVTELPAG